MGQSGKKMYKRTCCRLLFPLQHRVNCRIGSLENQNGMSSSCVCVNCRIGSLENPRTFRTSSLNVNCRIGSLEIIRSPAACVFCVNCRIGSLEKLPVILYMFFYVNCRIGSGLRTIWWTLKLRLLCHTPRMHFIRGLIAKATMLSPVIVP